MRCPGAVLLYSRVSVSARAQPASVDGAGRPSLQHQEFKVILGQPGLQETLHKVSPSVVDIPEGRGSCPTHRTQADRSRTKTPS